LDRLRGALAGGLSGDKTSPVRGGPGLARCSASRTVLRRLSPWLLHRPKEGCFRPADPHVRILRAGRSGTISPLAIPPRTENSYVRAGPRAFLVPGWDVDSPP
jgi:hypothetical protein